MAKVTFYHQPDGKIIKETKYSGNVERVYVTKEEMEKYESQRGAFAGLGCLGFVIFFAYIWFTR
ncbi:hypothetical protein [Bacillus rubiinfantis]|uniref:hypothetical protein n=1 Tax=Bacillus rubiinfantis TaxID=1499680 RepID=UPI0005A82EE5|nr:hypothetical protein [Bacillus rubiinfantis]